jgi:hypothetical protein
MVMARGIGTPMMATCLTTLKTTVKVLFNNIAIPNRMINARQAGAMTLIEQPYQASGNRYKLTISRN